MIIKIVDQVSYDVVDDQLMLFDQPHVLVLDDHPVQLCTDNKNQAGGVY